MKKAIPSTLPAEQSIALPSLARIFRSGYKTLITISFGAAKIPAGMYKSVSFKDASRAAELLILEADERASKNWFNRSPEDIEKQCSR